MVDYPTATKVRLDWEISRAVRILATGVRISVMRLVSLKKRLLRLSNTNLEQADNHTMMLNLVQSRKLSDQHHHRHLTSITNVNNSPVRPDLTRTLLTRFIHLHLNYNGRTENGCHHLFFVFWTRKFQVGKYYKKP